MKMIIGDQIVTAKIKEKEAAKNEFEGAKSAGKSASLLSEHRPNVFSMSVANIMPRDRIDIELHYTELLVLAEGVSEFVYSTVVGISAATAVLFSVLVAAWMSQPIKRLTRYAHDVREGKRVPMPPLDRSEIGEMGTAFERMRESLEGKNYVEHYVQTLTHEIKSPLAAIREAAELLEEEHMELEQQARFLANISSEANRIQDFVERLLELSALENLKILEEREKRVFHTLVKKVLEAKEALLTKKGLTVGCQIPSDVVVEGEPFLLHQAVSNLVQNAIDFSPAQGRIELTRVTNQERFVFTLRDQGPGIPDYAKSKVFDKFFSLPRPDTGKKGTGLGLNFVREVAVLHKGKVALDNCPEGGACATLTLPRA